MAGELAKYGETAPMMEEASKEKYGNPSLAKTGLEEGIGDESVPKIVLTSEVSGFELGEFSKSPSEDLEANNLPGRKSFVEVVYDLANRGMSTIFGGGYLSPKPEDEGKSETKDAFTPSPQRMWSKLRSPSSSLKRQFRYESMKNFQSPETPEYSTPSGEENQQPRGFLSARGQSVTPKDVFKGSLKLNSLKYGKDDTLDTPQKSRIHETFSTPRQKRSAFARLVNLTRTRIELQDSPQRRIVWNSGRAEFETPPSRKVKKINIDRIFP